MQGLTGAAANQLATKALQDYLVHDAKIDPDSPEGKTLMELASVAIGTAFGGGSGAATALYGEQFNRQLHPDEAAWINAHAAEFATQQGISVEEATQKLLVQAAISVDKGWRDALGPGDAAAQAFLDGAPVSVRGWGTMFSAEWKDYTNSSLFADVLLADRDAYKQVAGALAGSGATLGHMYSISEGWGRRAQAWGTNEDALQIFEMFSGDIGFAFGVGRKVVNGDTEGAAADVLTALALARAGTAAAPMLDKAADAVGAVLSKSLDEVAMSALLRSGGAHAADGKPLLNLAELTKDQKRVAGELFGENAIRTWLPDANKIGRAQSAGTNGIDDLYKVNRPDVDYVIVEYKFGSSKLGTSADGPQMSDGWILGSNRLLNAVRSDKVAQDIADAIRAGRVERWVVHTDPSGRVSVGMLDESGKFIPQPKSKLFGGDR